MRGILLLVGFFMVLAYGLPARAETCVASEFSGTWQNVRSETLILSSLEVVDTCDEKDPFEGLKIRAKEVCYPRDCSWGWTKAIIHNGRLFAEFKTYIAVRRITVAKQGLRLKVVVETDYITESREDTAVSHLLVRVKE